MKTFLQTLLKILCLVFIAIYFTACGGGGGGGGGGSSSASPAIEAPVVSIPTTTTTTSTTTSTSTTTTTTLSAPYTFGGGQGTLAQPYILQNATDVIHIRDFPSAYFWMQNDIDMAGINFIPIPSFSGVIYGRLFTLSNFTINYTSVDNTDYASFAQVLSGTIVQLRVTGNITGNKYASFLAGQMTATGMLSSCTVGGTVISPLGGNGVNVGTGNALWTFKMPASYVLGSSILNGTTFNGSRTLGISF